MSNDRLVWGKILSYLDFFQTKEIKTVVTGHWCILIKYKLLENYANIVLQI